MDFVPAKELLHTNAAQVRDSHRPFDRCEEGRQVPHEEVCLCRFLDQLGYPVGWKRRDGDDRRTGAHLPRDRRDVVEHAKNRQARDGTQTAIVIKEPDRVEAVRGSRAESANQFTTGLASSENQGR